ncbi:hypothetical protein [Sphingomonas panni]|uniref:hypothetical protein n=1 Tax=Sphingomonas panni TaxID=237612 RepID=UPI001F5B52CB|nr:hypothetical protein [Sphingomonas panni]
MTNQVSEDRRTFDLACREGEPVVEFDRAIAFTALSKVPLGTSHAPDADRFRDACHASCAREAAFPDLVIR